MPILSSIHYIHPFIHLDCVNHTLYKLLLGHTLLKRHLQYLYKLKPKVYTSNDKHYNHTI